MDNNGQQQSSVWAGAMVVIAICYWLFKSVVKFGVRHRTFSGFVVTAVMIYNYWRWLIGKFCSYLFDMIVISILTIFWETRLCIDETILLLKQYRIGVMSYWTQMFAVFRDIGGVVESSEPPAYFGPSLNPWVRFQRYEVQHPLCDWQYPYEFDYRKENWDFFSIIGMIFVGFSSLYLLGILSRRFIYFAKAMWQLVLDVTEKVSFEVDRSFIAEKMVPGSVFTRDPQPEIQCDVYIRMEGVPFTYVGQAFRVDNYLYTATHVVENATGVRFATKSGSVEIFDMKRITCVEGEITRVLMAPKEMGRLSLKSGKFSDLSNGKVFTTCYGNGQQSRGFLEPYDAFSYVQYDGSTVSGFSGAPYLIGKMILGMHLGGHTVNIGYDGQYLRMVHKRGQESSEEWLMDQLERIRPEVSYRRNPVDPDEYQIKFNGKYFMLDREEMGKLKKKGVGFKAVVGATEDYDFESVDMVVVNEPKPVFEMGFRMDLQDEPVDVGGTGKTLEKQPAVLNPELLNSVETALSAGHELTLDHHLSTHALLKHLSENMSSVSTEKDLGTMISQVVMKDVKRQLRQFLDCLNGASK